MTTQSPPTTGLAMRANLFSVLRIGLIAVLAVLILTGPGLDTLVERWWLPIIGVAGALVANSTGIGGGIVFVPVFDRLGLQELEAVGASLIIQSFGMTMGALTYLARRQRQAGDGLPNTAYVRIILLTVLPALAGALLATHGGVRPDLPVLIIFKIISLSLVVMIVGTELVRRPGRAAVEMPIRIENAILPVIGLVGGLFVGWISIGVGEILAVFLLLRGAKASDAVGLAVIVTSLTVLSLELTTGFSLPADVATGLLVAPGALIGGFLAPAILAAVGQRRVKWFCAAWIVLSTLAV